MRESSSDCVDGWLEDSGPVGTVGGGTPGGRGFAGWSGLSSNTVSERHC